MPSEFVACMEAAFRMDSSFNASNSNVDGGRLFGREGLKWVTMMGTNLLPSGKFRVSATASFALHLDMRLKIVAAAYLMRNWAPRCLSG